MTLLAEPRLAPTRAALALQIERARARGGRVALVPTMGALHDGHEQLIRAARGLVGDDGVVVVSVFVNPLQFGAGEDLDRYPRTLQADLEVCVRAEADVVFAPGVGEVYPGGDPQVVVEPGPLGERLEGASRPGHFRGVLTVVAKLLGLVRPDLALFGEKDYQQLTLIRRMADDLCLGVEIVGVPTVREPDGLALSSRNRYLDAAQREAAVALSAALDAAVQQAPAGVDAARAAALEVLAAEPGVELDYLEVAEADLAPIDAADPAPRAGRVLVAARVGATRLIDNQPLPIVVIEQDPRIDATEEIR